MERGETTPTGKLPTVPDLLPHLLWALEDLRRTPWGMIVVAWTIVVAPAIDPLFPDARGLAFGGNVPNTVAFLLFYVGIVTVVWWWR